MLGGGLDYSESGCDEVKERLKCAKVEGDIYCEDFFNIEKEGGLFNGSELQKYDLVYSLGVIEHFEDTKRIVKIFSKIVNNDGLIVSIIPNFSTFSFSKFFCYCYQPRLLDIHNLLSLEQLREAHFLDGFEVVESGYLGKFSMGIPSWGVMPRKIFGKNLEKHRDIGNKVTKFVWNRMKNVQNYDGNSIFAPYIYCVIKRKV